MSGWQKFKSRVIVRQQPSVELGKRQGSTLSQFPLPLWMPLRQVKHQEIVEKESRLCCLPWRLELLHFLKVPSKFREDKVIRLLEGLSPLGKVAVGQLQGSERRPIHCLWTLNWRWRGPVLGSGWWLVGGQGGDEVGDDRLGSFDFYLAILWTSFGGKFDVVFISCMEIKCWEGEIIFTTLAVEDFPALL